MEHDNMIFFRSALQRRIKVSHPNLLAFLRHLQRLTTDSQADVARLHRGPDEAPQFDERRARIQPAVSDALTTTHTPVFSFLEP